jgi:hypothetical protein
LFDLADDWLAVGQPEPAGEVCHIPAARKLEQRKRIAVALGDDLEADSRIERPVQIAQQQRTRIAVAESTNRHLRESNKDVLPDAGTDCADDRDPLGEEAAADKPKNLRRGAVQPVRVIDDTKERLLLGDLREERERRKTDEKSVRRRTGA